MSDIKFSFQEAKPELVQLVVGDKTYGYEVTTKKVLLGGVEQTGAEADKVLAELRTGFKPAFEEYVARAAGESTEKEFDAVKKLLTELDTKFSGAAELTKAKEAVAGIVKLETELHKAVVSGVGGAAPTFKKLSDAEAATIKGLMLKHPEAINLLPDNAVHILQNAETGGPAIQQAVANLRVNIKSIEDAVAEGKAYTKESLTELLAKSEKGVADHLPSELKSKISRGVIDRADPKKSIAGFDIDVVAKEVETKSAQLEKDALAAAKKVLNLKSAGKSEKKIAEAVAELKKISADNPHYGDRIGKHVHANLGETERAMLSKVQGMESVMSGYSKAANSTAENATKGRGIVSTLFFKNEEKLGKVAAELKKPVSELTTWQKVHGGKAAAWLIGAGAIVAYIAGIGRNPEQGKYTQAENDRRAGQSQAAGIGA